MSVFNYFKQKPNIDEVAQYTEDLRHMTILREKAISDEERDRYNMIIEGMQLVLIYLTERIK